MSYIFTTQKKRWDIYLSPLKKTIKNLLFNNIGNIETIHTNMKDVTPKNITTNPVDMLHNTILEIYDNFLQDWDDKENRKVWNYRTLDTQAINSLNAYQTGISAGFSVLVSICSFYYLLYPVIYQDASPQVKEQLNSSPNGAVYKKAIGIIKPYIQKLDDLLSNSCIENYIMTTLQNSAAPQSAQLFYDSSPYQRRMDFMAVIISLGIDAVTEEDVPDVSEKKQSINHLQQIIDDLTEEAWLLAREKQAISQRQDKNLLELENLKSQNVIDDQTQTMINRIDNYLSEISLNPLTIKEYTSLVSARQMLINSCTTVRGQKINEYDIYLKHNHKRIEEIVREKQNNLKDQTNAINKSLLLKQRDVITVNETHILPHITIEGSSGVVLSISESGLMLENQADDNEDTGNTLLNIPQHNKKTKKNPYSNPITCLPSKEIL